MIGAAMNDVGAKPIGTNGMLRFEYGDWDELPIVETKRSLEFDPTLEPVFSEALVEIPLRRTTTSPSDLGGRKALPGEDGLSEDEAKSYGNLVHKLLETLPLMQSDQWDGKLATLADRYDAKVANAALKEAVAVMNTPEIQRIFKADALVEVPITAPFGKRRLHGTIDRLLVTDTEVLAIDFKTNRIVPATPEGCPDGLLRQMGAYASALAQVFPDHRVSTAILWTRTAKLMTLPDILITNALSLVPDLDEVPEAT